MLFRWTVAVTVDGIPQRTLDIFDSIFTEDIDSRADAADVLAYIQSDFIEDACKIQGRDEVTVFGPLHPRPRPLAHISADVPSHGFPGGSGSRMVCIRG